MSEHRQGNSPVIDFHVHVVTPGLYERSMPHNALTGFGARPFAPPTPGSPRWPNYVLMTDAAEHVAAMDRRGVDMHVISVSPVSQSSFWAEPAEAAEIDRVANDGIADWVRNYPDRFVGAFTLPMQDMDLALNELDRAVNQLGLGVVSVSSNVDGVYLGEEKFRPFWKAADDLGVVVWIHPHGQTDPRMQKYMLWNGIGQPIEETTVIASIIYEGILDAYPGVDIVVAHGGGYLPHYIARLDRNATFHPVSVQNLKGLPSDYLRRFTFDSCVYAPSVLENLIRQVGADRIVLGSDYPVEESDPIGFVRGCSNVGEAEARLITGGNAAKILRLSETAIA